MLRFFLEYQWLVDFAVYATGVFLFTECYYSVVDARKEVNIGAIWCVLTVLFSLYPSTVKSHHILKHLHRLILQNKIVFYCSCDLYFEQ